MPPKITDEMVLGFIEHIRSLQNPIQILLVDDNASDLESVCELLNLFGDRTKVTSCNGGLKALEEMRKARFDLVLLDVRMPGMDGVGVIRQKLLENLTQPVALMTGLSNGPLVEECVRLGAVIHIRKPIRLIDLKNLFAILKL